MSLGGHWVTVVPPAPDASVAPPINKAVPVPVPVPDPEEPEDFLEYFAICIAYTTDSVINNGSEKESSLCVFGCHYLNSILYGTASSFWRT